MNAEELQEAVSQGRVMFLVGPQGTGPGEPFRPDVPKDKLPVYTEQMKLLWAGQNDAEKSLDQALITLQSGAFVITATLLGVIVPQPANPQTNRIIPNEEYLLFLTWGAFALSLLLTIISFAVSQRAWIQAQKDLNAHYGASTADAKLPVQDSRLRGLSTALRIGSMAAFGIGLVCFAMFARANL